MDIKGHTVHRVWVEHASDIAKEYYASFTLDRPAKLHLGMLSAEGGVEIEEVAVTNPEAIARLHVNPIEGLDLATATKWVAEANLDPEAREQAAALQASDAWRAARRTEALLVWHRGCLLREHYWQGDAATLRPYPLARWSSGPDSFARNF